MRLTNEYSRVARNSPIDAVWDRTGEDYGERVEAKEWDPNPWAVCHESVGPKKTKKFERCVQDVKRDQA